MTFDDILGLEPWEWPENARDLILAAIDDTSRSAEEREEAVHLAGDLVVMDDEVADRLMHLLRDSSSSPELRGAAAIAFGPVLESGDTMGFDDPDDVEVSKRTFSSIQQTLRLVYEDPKTPKFVARKCLEGAIRAPAKWQDAEVRKHYAGSDIEWKATAVFTMGMVTGFDREILESLDDERVEIRYEAVRAAGEGSVEKAWPKILDILRAEGTPKELLLAAIVAAASVNPEEAEDTLQPFLRSKDEEVRNTAEYAIEESHVQAMISGGNPDDFSGEE